MAEAFVKPPVGFEGWLSYDLRSVVVRAHTDSGIIVEYLNSYAKPTGELRHMRDLSYRHRPPESTIEAVLSPSYANDHPSWCKCQRLCGGDQ